MQKDCRSISDAFAPDYTINILNENLKLQLITGILAGISLR